MTLSAECGSGEEYGDEIVVGLEGVFSGVDYDPDADPTGLEMIVARINGDLTPIAICGNPGLGKEFEYPPAVLSGGGCSDPPAASFGGEIVVHSCQLNCNYMIDYLTASTAVIVGKIDGQWHILRILTGPGVGFGIDMSCRCCGVFHEMLKATISSACAPCEDLVGREIILRHGQTGWTGSTLVECEEQPPLWMAIGLICNADGLSEFEEEADWSLTVDNQAAEILDVECEGSGSGSGLGSGSGVDGSGCATVNVPYGDGGGFYLQARIESLDNFCGCTLGIIITHITGDECVEFEDVEIEEVIIEACGMPTLEVGTRVIIGRIPNDGRRIGTSGSGSGSGEPVEWYVIRACDNSDCGVPCNPEDDPPSGQRCCGVACEDLPSLTGTIEVIAGNCDCGVGGATVVFNKNTCFTDTRWTTDAFLGCDAPHDEGAGVELQISEMNLVCGATEDECAGSGSGEVGPGFSLIVDGVEATLDTSTSCCDPLFLEFEVTVDRCFSGNGMISATVTLRITITG